MIRAHALLAALALTLAGCATAPQPTVTPVEVKVPVPVPCRITPPEKPAFAVDALPLGSGIWDQMAALRAERKQRQGYEGELESAIKACE